MNAPGDPLVAPPPRALAPERLVALLERLDALDPPPELLASILKYVGEVRPVRHWFPTWQIGAHKVTRHAEQARLSVRTMGCSCRSLRRPTCHHVGAALVALAWNDPGHRAWFDEPTWALKLLPLVQPDAPDAPPARSSHRGWVRYHVVPPERGDWSVGSLSVERQLIRLARGGARELKPARCPASLEKLEEKLSDLTEADRAFADAWEQLAELGRLTRRGRAVGATERILSRLRRQLLEALADARDVRYLGAPIRVSTAPWRPALRAGEREDGGLSLDWAEPVSTRWDWGEGLVLTAGGELRPVAPGVEHAQLAAMDRPLPDIPADQISDFVERFALSGAVRVDLTNVRAGIADPDAVEGRLYLTEVGDALEVTARFGYRLGQAAVEVDPSDDSPLARSGDAYVRRDPRLERERLDALESALGQPPPLTLREERALDFLLEKAPALPHGWAVYGERELSRQVSGTATPSVSVPTGIDWFDLEFSFKADPRKKRSSATPRQVLKSWLDGRRYVRLQDGSFARLPMAWLERHGKTMADLLDMQRSGGRLGAHALPIAVGMLEEQGPDALPERWRALSKKLAGFESVDQRPTPPVADVTLRGYQRRGVDWLLFLRDHGLAGILADDMGLGKTLQALAALADTHEREGPPSLVVAPTSVVFNWAREAERFTPGLDVVIHHGAGRDPQAIDEADLVVTSYALLRLDRELFMSRGWRWMILDEAQAIKNPLSQVSRVAREIDARHRLAVTGTPLENDLVELWSLFQFLMPGFFGTRAGFQRRYGVPIRKHQDRQALNELRARARPFLLRRLKSEVASELPPRQEVVLWCELGDAQRALYTRVLDTYRESVLNPDGQAEHGRQRLHVLEALTRLRQACCHPDLLPFEEARAVTGSAKLDALMGALETAIPDGHRSLVFSQWPPFLKRVRERLDDRGWSSLYLDGSTTSRGALVDRWNDPEGPPVFLISLKAGGTGLNLTGADHVFHLDPWWNPAVEDQATDRAHRIGQTRPVVSYKLVARGTVEEKIIELQERKRALFQAAVDAERLVVDQLTRADLEVVFGKRAAVMDRRSG